MNNIIKIIAGRLGVDEEIVERSVRSEFKFVAEAMQQGNFESVHLHYWGKYCVKPNALKRLDDKQGI